jgi:hypothetical protein
MRTATQNAKDGEWHDWFAWHPVNTVCGSFVWLETARRRWNPNINFRIIDPLDTGDFDGGWQYGVPA